MGETDRRPRAARKRQFSLKALVVVVLAANALIAAAYLAYCYWPTDLTVMLGQARDPVYLLKDFPADGGSLVFFFASEREGGGANPFHVFLLHRDENMGGNESYQEIEVLWDGYAEYRREKLRAGSLAEARLIRLLENCSLGEYDPVFAGRWEFSRPRPGDLEWLLRRIRNRRAPWDEMTE